MFANIMHIKFNNGCELVIWDLINLKCFRVLSPMKSTVLFYSNGLATCIWHSVPDIMLIKVNNARKAAI